MLRWEEGMECFIGGGKKERCFCANGEFGNFHESVLLGEYCYLWGLL